MLNEQEVYKILVKELPGISSELKYSSPFRSFYDEAKCLSSYTKKIIESGNFLLIKKCFSVADMIMKNGEYCLKSVLMISFMKEVYPLLKDTISGASVRLILPPSIDQHFRYSLEMEKW